MWRRRRGDWGGYVDDEIHRHRVGTREVRWRWLTGVEVRPVFEVGGIIE